MDREGFVRLTVIAVGLVVASFFVRGFGQLAVGRPTADYLQAPLLVLGFLLFVYLFVRALLDAVGLWEVENPDG